jgi:hypothetical protein
MMLPYCIIVLSSIGKKQSVNLDYGRSSVEGHRKNPTCPSLKRHSEHTVHIYWHKIGKRFTDKGLLVESKREDHE